jgi:hypothetical protein
MATLEIRESRRFLIPLESAVDAVLQLDWEHGGWVAESALIEARIEAGENPALVLAVQRRGVPEPVTCRYSLPAVAAAIISLCRKTRIPLPHSWPKRLEIVPEGFELSLEGIVQFPRYHGALPGSGEFGAPESSAPESPAPSKGTSETAQAGAGDAPQGGGSAQVVEAA